MTRSYLLVLLLSVWTGCQAQSLPPMMDIQFYEDEADQPLALDVAPTPIRPADADVVLPPLAPPEERAALVRPFGSAERNSRTPASLTGGLWEPASTMSLDKAFPAQAVLYAEGRVLVQQEGAWQLFGRRGEPIAEGARAGGDVALDPEAGRLYRSEHNGYLVAHDLETGAELFSLYPMLGSGFDRSVVRSNGQHLWIVGTELPVMSHEDGRPGEYTILELQALGKQLATDEDDELISNRRLESLVTRPALMLTAAGGASIVLAAPGHLFVLDDALEVTADLEGAFEPLALSLDGTGLIYLVVRVTDESGAAAHAVWGLTPDGQRFLDVPIPAPPSGDLAPPIVGYDRTVYVVLGAEVVAVDAAEGMRWRQHAGTEIAGATVTADHQLVVTAGPRLLAIDRDGERRLVFEGPGETLRTPPVLVSPDRLYVASDSALYHLRPME